MSYTALSKHSTLVANVFATTRKRTVHVTDDGSASDDSTGDDTDSDSNMVLEKIVKSTEMNMESWTILKSIKYMRAGDPIACSVAMRSILSCNLSVSANLAAVAEEDGLEMLVNLTEVADFKCRLCALEVLKHITMNDQITTLVVLLGLAPILYVRLTDNHAKDEIEVVCDIIANIGRKRRAERAFRRKGAIPLLVDYLSVKKELLLLSNNALRKKESQIISLAKAATNALWTLSKFNKSKREILKAGIVEVMTPILVSKNAVVCPSLIGLLSECSTVFGFQVAIETEGLVGILLDVIKSDLKAEEKDAHEGDAAHYALTALARAAGGRKSVRHTFKYLRGYRILKKFLLSMDNDKTLVADALGLIWKTCLDHDNLQTVEAIGLDKLIVKYLCHTDQRVEMMAAGAVGEICKNKTCRQNIINKGAVPLLCTMFSRLDQPQMYANAAFAIGEIAKDPQGIAEIDGFDGLRFLWSLLKYPNTDVQCNVAKALVPCIIHSIGSGELIRGLTGSLVVLIEMLDTENQKVLAAICSLIAAVELDEENLAVLSEQGIVKLLSSVIIREDGKACRVENMRKDPLGLHRELAAAIGNCCLKAENRQKLGQAGVIPHLINYIHTKDKKLKEVACGALYALSYNSTNCATLHTCGAVPLLLCAIDSDNDNIQRNAAGCLHNIRRTLLYNETMLIKKRCETFTSDSRGSGRKIGDTEEEVLTKISSIIENLAPKTA